MVFRRASSHAPAQFSKYLITADFSDQQNPHFTNTTLDTKVTPRVGASMVFLPVGEKGILVVIGGVSVYDPIWMVGYGVRKKYSTGDLANQVVWSLSSVHWLAEECRVDEFQVASRTFLQRISIYDIGTDKW